jgi:hypothetical protein
MNLRRHHAHRPDEVTFVQLRLRNVTNVPASGYITLLHDRDQRQAALSSYTEYCELHSRVKLPSDAACLLRWLFSFRWNAEQEHGKAPCCAATKTLQSRQSYVLVVDLGCVDAMVKVTITPNHNLHRKLGVITEAIVLCVLVPQSYPTTFRYRNLTFKGSRADCFRIRY